MLCTHRADDTTKFTPLAQGYQIGDNNFGHGDNAPSSSTLYGYQGSLISLPRPEEYMLTAANNEHVH